MALNQILCRSVMVIATLFLRSLTKPQPMSRKVLLSFLGNNQYKQTRYTFKNRKSKVVRFVQEAILQLECADWKQEDQVFIFLTTSATKNNWEGDLYEGKGLDNALQAFSHLSIQPIKQIPRGISEQEIWTLFEKIFQLLSPQDEVYLDITNGFRSLPMLLMVLLDYAKVLKGIQVKKIYYGAFEFLGPYPKIKENMPNPEERLVPILDLTSFSALQDWAAAAADFQLHGSVRLLSTLTNNSLEPILKTAKGKEVAAQTLQQIDRSIQELIPLIRTNRGKNVSQFGFDALNLALEQFSKNKGLIQPLTPIIEQIKNKVKHFKDQDALFWLKTTRWCLQHGLIQQGITQLQEGLITWFCFRFKQMTGDAFFDAYSKEARNLINSSFTLIEKKTPEKKWRNVVGRYPHYTKMVLQDPLIQQSVLLTRNIGKLRNDINHGGYILQASESSFTEKLQEYLVAVTQLVDTSPVQFQMRQGTGLVNCSHHPFTKWKVAQRELALQRYGKVEDVPFPMIDPTISADALVILVEQFYRQIKAMQPTAVHLMGEMTFTYALVQRLKNIGITCIASTGERTVEDIADGQLVQFAFVGFRVY